MSAMTLAIKASCLLLLLGCSGCDGVEVRASVDDKTVEAMNNLGILGDGVGNIGKEFLTTPIFRAFQEELAKTRDLEAAVAAAKRQVDDLKTNKASYIRVDITPQTGWDHDVLVKAKVKVPGKGDREIPIWNGIMTTAQERGISLLDLAGSEPEVSFFCNVEAKTDGQGARVTITVYKPGYDSSSPLQTVVLNAKPGGGATDDYKSLNIRWRE